MAGHQPLRGVRPSRGGRRIGAPSTEGYELAIDGKIAVPDDRVGYPAPGPILWCVLVLQCVGLTLLRYMVWPSALQWIEALHTALRRLLNPCRLGPTGLRLGPSWRGSPPVGMKTIISLAFAAVRPRRRSCQALPMRISPAPARSLVRVTITT
jgi:hypothetical protein